MEKSIYEKIENLIEQGEIKQAIEELKNIKNTLEESDKSPITQISQRYHTLLQENILGIIKPEDYRVEINKISNNILDILKNLREKSTDKDSSSTIINIISTIFFKNRIASAFPGVRGITWFDKPSEALERLEILLESPVNFDITEGYQVTAAPVWWFRGDEDLPIRTFKKLTQTKGLLDINELEIKRIAIYKSRSYWKSFVYVEIAPDSPSGVYENIDERIKNQLQFMPYATEQICLFGDKYFSSQEHDDGAGIVEGKVVKFEGRAEARVRYLTPYNFIIAAYDSPYNSKACNEIGETILNGILKGTHTLEDFIRETQDLPRKDI